MRYLLSQTVLKCLEMLQTLRKKMQSRFVSCSGTRWTPTYRPEQAALAYMCCVTGSCVLVYLGLDIGHNKSGQLTFDYAT